MKVYNYFRTSKTIVDIDGRDTVESIDDFD